VSQNPERTWRPARSRHADFLKVSPAAAKNCITLTIFNPSPPCRIQVAEETAGGIVVRKIGDEGFRLRERVQDDAESPGFPAANVGVAIPSAAVQFEGIGADSGDFS
jgi:hypothetical protein